MGTRGADSLVGTAGDDVIVGRGGPDTIDGGGGNDVICGDAGRDALSGGIGDDVLDGGTVDEEDTYDLLWGGPDDDRLVIGSGAYDVYFSDPAHPDAGAAVTLDLGSGGASGEGADVLDLRTAFPQAQFHVPDQSTVTGSSGSDTVYAGAGSTLDLHGGDDTAHVTSATVTAGRGSDTVFVRPHAGAALSVSLGRGADLLAWNGGLMTSDRLAGGPGRDGLTAFLHRAPEQAHAYPLLRFDLAHGRVAADGLDVSVTGFADLGVVVPRHDQSAPARFYEVDGTPGSNAVTFEHLTGAHSLTLRLSGGSDRAYLGSEDDTVYGGPGIDTAYTHEGHDICHQVERCG